MIPLLCMLGLMGVIPALFRARTVGKVVFDLIERTPEIRTPDKEEEIVKEI